MGSRGVGRRSATLLLVAAVLGGGPVACGVDRDGDEPDEPLIVAEPPAGPVTPVDLDRPVARSGFFEGDEWPPACDLLTDDELTTVLPQATVAERTSSDQDLTILGSGGVITAADSYCSIRLDIPAAGLPDDDVTGPTIAVTVEAAGAPEVAAENLIADEGAGAEPIPTSKGACYGYIVDGIQCLEGAVAFTLRADLPFQQSGRDRWTDRFRVGDETTTFAADFGATAETEDRDRFVRTELLARLAEPILAKL